MSFVEDFLNQLFPKDHQNRVMIDSGQLIRTEHDATEYEVWKALHAKDIIQEISRNFNLSKRELRDDLKTVWFENSSAHGFQIQLTSLSEHLQAPWMLLDFLAESILQNGYRKYTSSYEAKEVNGKLKRIERHYLKPVYSIEENELGQFIQDQKYGNVLIEFLDERNPKLKLLVTYYHDRNFTKALPTKDLFRELFPGLDS